MKIKFLGTAAAEGLPAVFCRCDTCNNARMLRGKNIRTRSQMMINSDMLVDFPMDTYMHALQNNLDLSAVAYVFITHAHMDHCYPQDLTLHGGVYAHNMSNGLLSVFGNKSVIDKIIRHNESELCPEVENTLRLKILQPYQKVSLPKYCIHPLRANHTRGEDCLIYVIENGGKTALIMNDTGRVDEEVYAYIKDAGIRIDFVSFDCTYGLASKPEGRHMGVYDNLFCRELMETYGILNENALFYLTHFSHNGGSNHDELTEKVKQYGLNVAYDGLEILL